MARAGQTDKTPRATSEPRLSRFLHSLRAWASARVTPCPTLEYLPKPSVHMVRLQVASTVHPSSHSSWQESPPRSAPPLHTLGPIWLAKQDTPCSAAMHRILIPATAWPASATVSEAQRTAVAKCAPPVGGPPASRGAAARRRAGGDCATPRGAPSAAAASTTARRAPGDACPARQPRRPAAVGDPQATPTPAPPPSPVAGAQRQEAPAKGVSKGKTIGEKRPIGCNDLASTGREKDTLARARPQTRKIRVPSRAPCKAPPA
jgi:hypothetical protein